jgi:hypothetical protein
MTVYSFCAQSGLGTAFEIDQSGTLTTLYNFFCIPSPGPADMSTFHPQKHPTSGSLGGAS